MSTERHPVVVTDYAALNALGRDRSTISRRLSEGLHCLRPPPFDLPFPTVCGRVDLPIREDGRRSEWLALAAFEQIAGTLQRAKSRWGAARVGLVVGTSTGGIGVLRDWHHSGGGGRAPTFAPFVEVIRRAGDIHGPAYAVSTACSSSSKTIGSALRLIDASVCDAVLIAGVDELWAGAVSGFNTLKLVSEQPSRPFGRDRNGINLGEAAAFMLLEREGRGPRLLGVGESSDAFHQCAPDPEGHGAALAMRRALAGAGLAPADIGFVNAHGTGTKLNDITEARAIAAVLGREVPVASTKGYTGHTLGAAGLTEAILSLIALEEGWIPKSVGSEDVDPDIEVNVCQEPKEMDLSYVLTNSFAFGGANVSVIFGKEPRPPSRPRPSVDVGVSLSAW